MARSFSSSRISIHSTKHHRRRVRAGGGTQQNNRPTIRSSNNNDSDESSSDTFEVFDICDKSPDGGEFYKVRWKGYPERKYDTFEPASHLRSVGLESKLKEVDDYVKWRKQYMLENPEASREPSIYVYRKRQGKPSYAANEDFTCVLTALNVITILLKIKFSFNSILIHKFGGKEGFTYSKLRKMISYQQKTIKRGFLFIEGIKQNRSKRCCNNTGELMEDLSKEPGVYFCGAGNVLGLHHVFVLVVRGTGIYIFDDAFGWNNKLLDIDDLGWISRWKFVLKGTRKD